MKTESIHQLVQERAGCESAQQAARCTAAVLGVLAHRNLGGEGDDFAAQLPDELAYIVRNPEGPQEKFDAPEFLRRVGAELDVAEESAETTTHAVLSAVADSVTGGEKTDLLAALPEDLNGYAMWNRP